MTGNAIEKEFIHWLIAFVMSLLMAFCGLLLYAWEYNLSEVRTLGKMMLAIGLISLVAVLITD